MGPVVFHNSSVKGCNNTPFLPAASNTHFQGQPGQSKFLPVRKKCTVLQDILYHLTLSYYTFSPYHSKTDHFIKPYKQGGARQRDILEIKHNCKVWIQILSKFEPKIRSNLKKKKDLRSAKARSYVMTSITICRPLHVKYF